jgi:hypothetical protein
MYMKDSVKYGDEGGKDFGCAADELTPQACYRSDGLFYVVRQFIIFRTVAELLINARQAGRPICPSIF